MDEKNWTLVMENSYKKRMQRKKAYIDSRIEAANIDKGIIVLLTGNGKANRHLLWV